MSLPYHWFGKCEQCGKQATLAFKPKSEPPIKICPNCYEAGRQK